MGLVLFHVKPTSDNLFQTIGRMGGLILQGLRIDKTTAAINHSLASKKTNNGDIRSKKALGIQSLIYENIKSPR
jgi:hypothetical protein